MGAQPPSHGLIVQVVTAGGPAARAGVQPLDVVESVEGKTLSSSFDLSLAVANKKPGDVVSMVVWHQGKTQTLSVTLEDLEGSA